KGKEKNKKIICEQFGLKIDKPLIIFIGRLVGEKAADILADAIVACMYSLQGMVNFLVLGSGDPHVESQLQQLTNSFQGNYNAMIGYNETLSHQMYAAADFILMPSRVEPCGLNQMYAMQYGTVPIVRSTGGLKDTVIDMDDDGWGIRFNHASVGDIIHSAGRAAELYYDKKEQLHTMRNKMMQINNSWENSVQKYLDVYKGLK
ncbi:MAG: glycosyltransferase, partial [Parafilimonas sp.]